MPYWQLIHACNATLSFRATIRQANDHCGSDEAIPELVQPHSGAAASDVPVLGCTPGRSDRGDQAAAKHSTSDAVSGSNIQTWSMWTHMIVVDPARRSDARLFHCLDAHHTPSHVHVHVHAHVHVVHHARSRTREARLGAE